MLVKVVAAGIVRFCTLCTQYKKKGWYVSLQHTPPYIFHLQGLSIFEVISSKMSALLWRLILLLLVGIVFVFSPKHCVSIKGNSNKFCLPLFCSVTNCSIWLYYIYSRVDPSIRRSKFLFFWLKNYIFLKTF